MLNKLAVLLLTLTALGGCGYKGALYIPDAPSQNTPPSSDVSSDASFDASYNKSEQASNGQNTVSHFVSGSAPKTPLTNTPMIAPITKFGDSN
ncbi:LPS translocon maturation chaperone LptM [Alteromonas sp. BMJM2]|uniref:LPS translocon maturation chaperone LptM n=1 Tax=Alteromonas sp. BMJM2 TaxID=2954241 RepID=UPI0022B300D9|nr:lipoprotein [Alteromonas sp. BMJM2]